MDHAVIFFSFGEINLKKKVYKVRALIHWLTNLSCV